MTIGVDPVLLTRPADGATLTTPLLVVGGSTAAYAASLAALSQGCEVCLVQPTALVGGQYTAQALPATDDPPQVAPPPAAGPAGPGRLAEGEAFGFSRSQRRFRDRQRQLQPLAGEVCRNPGGSWVSHFSVTPATALAALLEPLLPHLERGTLRLVAHAEPVDVELRPAAPGQGDPLRRVTAVRFRDARRQVQFRVEADLVVEATDLGDLLELAGIESRLGQEARADTGEAALPEEARPRCQQAFTFGIVVEHAVPTAGQWVPAPPGHGTEPWLRRDEYPHVFWVRRGERWRSCPFFAPEGMFRYRRLARSLPDERVRLGDVSVLNWGVSPLGRDGHPPQPGCLGCGNDDLHGNLVGGSREERRLHLERARDRARSYLHFLQGEAGLALVPRGDLTWTADGVALDPYVREARRGVAVTTVRHEDVARPFFAGRARARSFDDSVGIGAYLYLDFHPNGEPGHVDLGPEGRASLPFTIPLGALIPIHTEGLLLSAKSIGTTHITNAAYRMHPVEWAIGEAGGLLAAFCRREGVEPRQVRARQLLLRRFQSELLRRGIPLVWIDDLGHDDPDFEAIQMLVLCGIVAVPDPADLHVLPEGGVSRAEAGAALGRLLERTPPEPAAASPGGAPISRWELARLMEAQGCADSASLWRGTDPDGQPLRRRELCRVLHRLWLRRL